MHKFLSFRPDPLRPMNLKDDKKWASTDDGKTFKLIAPDIEKDKQYAYAEIKSAKAMDPAERLQITGIANANIMDRMQERLDPVGVDLQHYLKNAILLAHHSYYHPIGQVDAIEIQEDGVHFSGWIGDPSKAKLTPMQEEIRSLVSQGILKTVSVGFIPKKVRAPLYNEAGNLEEPCVIEQWELLELSVVAVPCNQDSVFQVRNGEGSAKILEGSKDTKSLNDSAIKNALDDAKAENMVVQSFIFDKAKFTEQTATAWAKEHGFRSDKVDETNDSFRLRQKDPADFDQSTFRTIDITEGVKAVVGKIQKDAAKDTNGDSKEAGDAMQQIMASLQSMNEGMSKLVEVCNLILQKVEAEVSAETDTTNSDAGKATDAEGSKVSEDAKKLETRIDNLEKRCEKLISSVSLLVAKLNK